MIVVDRGRIVSEVRPKDMSVADLTEYLDPVAETDLRRDPMARPEVGIDLPAIRRPADHRCLHRHSVAVHVSRAGGLPAAVPVHDVPLDPAAGDAARDRAHVHHRRGRDRPLVSPPSSAFPASSLRSSSRRVRTGSCRNGTPEGGFLASPCGRAYSLGRRGPRARVGRSHRLHQRRALSRRSASPRLSRHSARSSSGPAWRRCCRAASPTPCAGAERLYGMADGSSGARSSARSSVDWMQRLPIQWLWTALIIVCMWFMLNRHRFGEHALFIGDSNRSRASSASTSSARRSRSSR